MPKDPSSFQQDPDNTVVSLQGRPTVTRSFDTIAGEMVGVASSAGSWAKDQIHQGLSEFVSRTLGLPENGHDPAKDIDRDRGMDR